MSKARTQAMSTAPGSIFFCGDIHGEFRRLIAAVLEHRPDAIVLLGDIQAKQPLEIALAKILGITEVWFIHGNHDTDTEADHDNLLGSALADRNLHGRVVDVAGVRIAGLGGIFRGQVWRPPEPQVYRTADHHLSEGDRRARWRSGTPLKHRSSIYPATVERLAGLSADVLVTHEAPSCHPYGFDVIDDLARRMKVGKSFHGHHHDCLDYSGHRSRLGFEAFGVGLRGITDLYGRTIRVGEMDVARARR